MKQVPWRNPAARRGCAGIGLALALSALAPLAPVWAAPNPGEPSSSDRRQESFSRATLLQILDDVAALARSFREDAAIRAGIDDARRRVETASQPELEALREHALRLTHMAQLLERIRMRLAVAPPDEDFPSDPPSVVEPVLGRPEPRFPAASSDPTTCALPIPTLAPSALCAGSRRASSELIVLLEEVLGAEIGQMENSRLCNQVIVLSGNGGNLSLLCILSDVIFLTVRGSYDSMLLCERLLDRSDLQAAALGVAQVRGDVTSAQASLNGVVAAAKFDIAASVENSRAQLHADLNAAAHAADVHAAGIVAQVNANTASVQSAMQAQTDLFLRLEIERVLHSGKHYAAVYLPEANGGHLGLARLIVLETIQAVQASGETVNAAQQNFNSAEQDYAARRWKRAFSFYSDAYFEAVKVLGEVSLGIAPETR